MNKTCFHLINGLHKYFLIKSQQVWSQVSQDIIRTKRRNPKQMVKTMHTAVSGHFLTIEK